jgi:transposase
MGRRKSTEELRVETIREILRLKSNGLSGNKIAQSCNISRSITQKYIKLINASGVTFEGSRELSDSAILKLLGIEQSRKRKDVLDCEHIHSELSRAGVTLQLLWEEYNTNKPSGYSYSSFCLEYRRWRKRQKLTMRQVYKAGQKCFVDYAGQTLRYYDRVSETWCLVQIFVGALGASNYTYAEATQGQDLKSWLGSHERMFEYFGGVTELVVPDNLKSGVNSACRYEPELNKTYQQLAQHYQVAVLPARVRKPQDKAKVEEAVQNVERRILAKLRDRAFYGLAEINIAIKELLEELNNRLMKSYGCSRCELFERLDKPALSALPKHKFEFGKWKVCKVNIDYHIEAQGAYYSVPYQYVGEKLDVWTTEKTISVFKDSKRIVQHVIGSSRGRYHTKKEHMPAEHRFISDWTPTRFISWAGKIGPHTTKRVQGLLESRAHVEQAYRSCLGLLSLEKKYGKERLENAVKKANGLGIPNLKSIKSMLKTGQDKIAIGEENTTPTIEHCNLRGSNYYH